ncbi:hypothetical protein EV182_002456, partial [Spiromyces aspiralis]
TVLYFYITERRKEPEDRLLSRMQTQTEVELLLDNLRSQFHTFRHMPITWRGMKPYYTHYLFSWLFILVLAVSLVLVVLGMALDEAEILRVATFTFIASLNALFMTRQHLYYMRRMHLTADAKHHLVMDTTVFEDYDRTWANWLQVIILLLEFAQLLSFPIRDLLTNISIVRQGTDNDTTTRTIDFVVSVASMFTNLSSRFYITQFWFLFAITLFAAASAAFIHVYNNRAIFGLRLPSRVTSRQWRAASSSLSCPQIPLFWITYIVPVVSLLYLPILVMLVGSASCLSKLGTEDSHLASTGILRCDDPSINKPFYLSCTLVVYVLAYVMLTVFVTSYDRIPIKGEIQFKSMGTAFIKNMSLLLSIDLFLVQNKYSHIRSIISLVIMISMVCFNIHVQPCYVRKINFWRSYLFCSILWTVLVVAMLTNEGTTLEKVSDAGVAAVIAAGIVILLGLYVGIWFYKRDEWAEANADRPGSYSSLYQHGGRSIGFGGSYNDDTLGRMSFLEYIDAHKSPPAAHSKAEYRHPHYR